MRPERVVPGPGQESVWDYPRPPRIESCTRRVRVVFAGRTIAQTDGAMRVLETAGAPTVYVPPADVDLSCLAPAAQTTYCEWKGNASYFDVVVGDARAPRAAWAYERPTEAFRVIAGFLSFYPALVECELGGERVRPQPGGFYGGWVTDDIVGPFKGEAGTEGW